MHDLESNTMNELLSMRKIWDVLGPFEIGTREAAWGADPLEMFGGFSSLEPDRSVFRSSLSPNASVKWSTRTFNNEADNKHLVAHINLVFPSIAWTSLRNFYGWSALQYQAWARSYVTLNSSVEQTFELYTDGILEFNIDGRQVFGGDFYSYRRAPLVVNLQPGSHKIELRLIRDIRSMGGSIEDGVQCQIELRRVPPNLVADTNHLLVPDLVDLKLASQYATIPVRNCSSEVLTIVALESDKNYLNVLESSEQALPLQIVPGQTRPLIFHIEQTEDAKAELSFRIVYTDSDQKDQFYISVKHELINRERSEPHVYTYLKPSNVVSFALVRLPGGLDGSNPTVSQSLPVFVYLHGAGVETNSDDNRGVLDGAKELPAWTVFASGSTSWSGDDWHQWGWADVEAAVEALPQYIISSGWKGPGVDISKWMMAGHSNGGQGIWYALTHRPDKILAAAPVSGYSSIQNYIPYSFWQTTDPRCAAVVQTALNPYRHELLMSNIKGIPVAQQHGSDDDNVPCTHSRLLLKLSSQNGWDNQYHEVAHGGHFDPGVMTTPFLHRFYRHVLDHLELTEKELPSFTLTVANPADTGSKKGVKIERLVDPGQLGKIEVQQGSRTLSMNTSNVDMFSLCNQGARSFNLKVDMTELEVQPCDSNGSTRFVRADHRWQELDSQDSSTRFSLSERTDNQLGNLDAILRSKGKFWVQNCHETTRDIALSISRNLFQYFAADVEIFERGDRAPHRHGNLITIGVGSSIAKQDHHQKYPLILDDHSISIRDKKEYNIHEHQSIGAIFLSPLEENRLELVIWGTEYKAVAQAARLMPLLTGAGQPDFIILAEKSRWRGIDGVLAMGFFDSSWEVSSSSFLY